MADALGGTCGALKPPEIGILEIELAQEGRNDSLFEDLPTNQKCCQWYGVEVAQPPEDAVILATSKDCRIQAMRIGTNAWSMQYHVELEPNTVENWSDVSTYFDVLMGSIGKEGFAQMKSLSSIHMEQFLNIASKIYGNFMKSVG